MTLDEVDRKPDVDGSRLTVGLYNEAIFESEVVDDDHDVGCKHEQCRPRTV